MTLDRVSTPELARVRIMADTLESRLAPMNLARAEFEQAIREAHQAGHSMRAIAQAAGISHQRVAQLLQKGER